MIKKLTIPHSRKKENEKTTLYRWCTTCTQLYNGSQNKDSFSQLLGLVSTSGWNRKGFFTAGIKCFVLNGRECTDSCFTAVFFQMQHASFSVWCSGCTVVGGGNGIQKNKLTCLHTQAAKQLHDYQFSSAVVHAGDKFIWFITWFEFACII